VRLKLFLVRELSLLRIKGEAMRLCSYKAVDIVVEVTLKIEIEVD
jgi:hypothetical protein